MVERNELEAADGKVKRLEQWPEKESDESQLREVNNLEASKQYKPVEDLGR